MNNLQIGLSTNHINIPIYHNFKVLQITLGNPNDPTYEKINNYSQFETKTLLFIHTKYTYNISKKNINYSIKEEIDFLSKIKQNNTGIVIHLSKYYLNKDDALIDVADKLNELCLKYLDKTTFSIILETSYNKNHLGATIDDFYVIFSHLNNLSKQHIGFCIDTSHIYLAGYAINHSNILLSYLSEFEKKIGLKYVKLIHLNDIDSNIYGKHTQHLSILDKNGKIFFNNNLSLEIILNTALAYNIPIILERKDKNITDEQNYLLNFQPVLSVDIFKNLIQNIIILDFINLLIDFYTVLKNDTDVKILTSIKTQLIEIYNYKNKELYLSSKLIKFSNQVLFNILKKHSNSENLENIFKNFLNDYSYEIFLKYENNNDYKQIKNLMEVKFLGLETARNLFYNYNITSLTELQNLPIKEKKKILSVQQYKALQSYKFIKDGLLFENIKIFADEIMNKLGQKYNINVYGSIYRIIKNNLVDINLKIKDIDLLLVYKNKTEIDDFIKDLNDIFLFKGFLVDGDKKKNIVYKGTNKKNYYFILDLYTCTPEEELYMSIYLKGPIEYNIMLRRIAKAKGYLLNNYSFKNIKTNKYYYFNTEKELLNFLNINIQ